MTLPECKDKVAKKNGFGDWDGLQKEWLKRTVSRSTSKTRI